MVPRLEARPEFTGGDLRLPSPILSVCCSCGLIQQPSHLCEGACCWAQKGSGDPSLPLRRLVLMLNFFAFRASFWLFISMQNHLIQMTLIMKS